MTEISIPVNKIKLKGILNIPNNTTTSLVIFSHGDGSNRNSPRNRFVAESLQSAGIGTLLVDLLTEEEQIIDSQDKRHRFDISLISDRLYCIIQWIQNNPDTAKLKLGILGASTGAAAAINAAARLDGIIQAIVLRSGRPDLAHKDSLKKIQIPTLMILGGGDPGTIKNNQKALDQMKNITNGTKKRIVLIPGGTHLLEEEGVFAEAAKFAVSWFERYLLD
jgi:dienelactone hydrolase